MLEEDGAKTTASFLEPFDTQLHPILCISRDPTELLTCHGGICFACFSHMSCQCTISFWFLVPLANSLEAFRHVVDPTKSRWKLKCERPAASSIAFGTCEQKAPACWAAKQRIKRWQRMSKIKMKTKAQMTNANHSSLKNCLKTFHTPNIHMLLEF